MRIAFKYSVCMFAALAASGLVAADWPMAAPASPAPVANFASPNPGMTPGPAHPAQPAPPMLLASEAVEGPAEFWTELEYLLWWMKPVCQKKPLLNTGSESDAVPGAAGQPNTRPILGSSKYEMPAASGARATIGFWLPEYQEFGWEASGFWLPEVRNTHAFSSFAGSPATYLPYTDQNNISQALPFTIPGQVEGGIVATGSSELWGAETNALWRVAEQCGICTRRVVLLAGFRYVNLRDEILINQAQIARSDASFALGGAQYVTQNHFFGGQVGARVELNYGDWSIEATGKFAPGETKLISDIAGSALYAGQQVLPGSVPGPLLAFPSNIGRSETWALSFAQELSLKLRYRLSQNVQATLGYDLLYLNRIVCPGDQMPLLVNVTQIPQLGPVAGKVEPKPLLFHTDYFAQGLTAGLEFRY